MPSGRSKEEGSELSTAAGMEDLIADSKALQQRVAARRAAKGTEADLSPEDSPGQGLP